MDLDDKDMMENVQGKLKDSISLGLAQSSKPYSNQETRAYLTYLKDLLEFIYERVGSEVALAIPQLLHPDMKSRNEIVGKMTENGFKTCHWTRERLNMEQVKAAINEVAVLHATGLVYRMNLKEDICMMYPWLMEDMYSSYVAKELLAKYLNSFLQFLSQFENAERTVHKLNGLKNNIIELISSLRRPSDTLGTR